MSRNNTDYYYRKFLSLFKRYNAGKATHAERDFIEAYDEYLDNRPGFYENLPEDEQQAVIEQMLTNIHGRLNETPDLPSKRHSLSIWVRASAAALLICGSVLIWKRFEQTKRPKAELTQTERFKNDVLPGHDGAILTLSNGTKVTLDTLGADISFYDGKARIIKQNGKISYQGQAGDHQYNTITTPVGRQWKLVLPDGTKVWLNAASSIRYPLAFNTDKRMVIMTGEVYFEVKHNAKQPFLVTVNGQVIEDIGTAFDVKAYDDEKQVKTTLVEGRVKISSGTNNPPVVLHPGQQADLDINGSLKVVNNVDLENILAWKDGITSFKDADIQTIMREVARWYNVKVAYEGEIPDRLFTGEIMRTSNLSDLLKILEESNIRFKIDGNTITVMQ